MLHEGIDWASCDRYWEGTESNMPCHCSVIELEQTVIGIGKELRAICHAIAQL